MNFIRGRKYNRVMRNKKNVEARRFLAIKFRCKYTEVPNRVSEDNYWKKIRDHRYRKNKNKLVFPFCECCGIPRKGKNRWNRQMTRLLDDSKVDESIDIILQKDEVKRLKNFLFYTYDFELRESNTHYFFIDDEFRHVIKKSVFEGIPIQQFLPYL